MKGRFPSCPSATEVISICFIFLLFNRLSLGNKLAKAVKLVEYAVQVSGGREGDYFQTYFTVYVERLLPYNLADCQALKQCNFPLNHEI